MRCKKCNMLIPDDETICRGCGATLRVAEPEPELKKEGMIKRYVGKLNILNVAMTSIVIAVAIVVSVLSLLPGGAGVMTVIVMIVVVGAFLILPGFATAIFAEGEEWNYNFAYFLGFCGSWFGFVHYLILKITLKWGSE